LVKYINGKLFLKPKKMSLYTKEGKPLQERGDIIYSSSGTVIGKKKGTKVFGTNGQYVGTIVRDRLTYLHQDSASMGSTFSAGNIGGSERGNIGSVGINGDEPKIPK
jgi:hypothetical protein